MSVSSESESTQPEDIIREHCIEVIKNSTKHKLSDCETAEFGAFEICISDEYFDVSLYNMLIVKIITNLKNSEVTNSLKNGTISYKNIASLEKDDLNSEKWQLLQNSRIPKEKKEIKKGIYKCQKCKSWETTHIQIQTRSADEGMTTKVSCTVCNNHWRIN